MTPEEALRTILKQASTVATGAVVGNDALSKIRELAREGLKTISPKNKELVVLFREPFAASDECPWSAKIRDTSLAGWGDTPEEALDSLLADVKVAESFRAKVLALAKGEA